MRLVVVAVDVVEVDVVEVDVVVEVAGRAGSAPAISLTLPKSQPMFFRKHI